MKPELRKPNMPDVKFIGIGLIFGIIFGAIIDNVGLGVALGLIVGVVLVNTVKKQKKSEK